MRKMKKIERRRNEKKNWDPPSIATKCSSQEEWLHIVDSYQNPAEKSLPFFKTLRKVKDLWTEECQQAFEELKAHLAKLPLLVKPIPGDTRYLYLSSTSQTVSSVLIREKYGAETPIYYVSKVLNRAECRYQHIEEVVLALVTTIRILHPYFLSYPVGAQGLANFVSEMTGTTQEEVFEKRPWLLHVYRSSTAQGSGAGVVITSPQGEDMEFAIKFNFKACQRRQHGTLLPTDRGVKYKVQKLQQILKEENVKADSLPKLASALEDDKTRRIIVQHLTQPQAPLNIQAISLNDND
ncbi:hypothetical protein Sango_2698800 [Sesamum angolense]|uniref:Reverse transcriptase/retrotransposon-derived protein RNase H-like domain-containing protein n=1 Tax=Sesamum angolense TaxID=2727404 RepID=A0AAE1W2X3_9LAMI|nr:hypothetical protein Sango_2698800 [Sesamum angolense]